jgi:hypothetical protein
MAVDFGGQDITVTSGADLSAKQFYATTMETSGKIALANSVGEKCVGILQNKPSADGKIGRVRINGVSKVVVSSAVEEGAELSAASSGKLTTASAAHYILAIALEPSSADGDIIRVMLVNYQKNT